MNEDKRQQGKAFQVDELDDAALEDVAGGFDLNGSCPTTTNSGCNVVAGCGGGTSTGTTIRKET